ncbi:MAG: hypothetical protein H8D87_00235 [Deltaproteobacteria bacterium]|nr:hypothetical protein [Candidatus Desulfobacula maris]
MTFEEWAKRYYPNESKEVLQKMSHAWAAAHVNMIPGGSGCTCYTEEHLKSSAGCQVHGVGY